MAGRVIDEPAAKARILQALRAASTREAAAEYAGISRATFFRWVAQDETLASQVIEAEAAWQVQSAALVLKDASAGDWRAAAWLLERHPRSKQFWKRIDQHDLACIPTHRLLQMLSAAEEGIDSAGDAAAAETGELHSVPG